MNSKKTDRRKFLQGSAALAGLAVGAVPFTRAQTLQTEMHDARTPKDLSYGERSRFENSVRTVTLGGPRDVIPGLPPGETGQRVTPLQDSTGIITPSSLHFMTARGPRLPDIDHREHRLLFHGLVDLPLIFTRD